MRERVEIFIRLSMLYSCVPHVDLGARSLTKCKLSDKTSLLNREAEGVSESDLAKRVAQLEEELAQARAREERLRETNNSLVDLFNSSPAAIITLDYLGRVRMWNPAAERIFGWTKEEVLGQTNPIVPVDKLQWFFERHNEVVQGEALVGMEADRSKKDGTPIHVSVSTAQVVNDEGKVETVIGVIHDITARKLVEQENQELMATLEQRVRQRTAELEGAMRDLESFSYSISHDLRAPLRSISSFSSILMEDYNDSLDEDAQDLLGRVVRNSERMSQLIDDLLEFSRTGRQPINRATTDIEEMARSILEGLQAEEPQRKVDVQMGVLPEAAVDPSLFRQVMFNLLSNAWKFTGKTPEARIEISGITEGEELVYRVKDNGAGFSMEYADKLFAVFQRLHRAEQFEGTGVGLAIVAKIVNRHGGTISAFGEPDKGAEFEIRLPLNPV